MMSEGRLNIVTMIIFILVIQSSCYEPEEGCLDIDATNYDVGADNACSDCCTLPEFDLLVSYLYNGESYSFGQDTIITRDDSIVINDFHFILSDITLIDENGMELLWEDTYDIYNSGQVVATIDDDSRYFTKTTFRGTINGLRYNGGISQLSFNLGLEQEINFYDRDSLNVNSELDVVPDAVYDEVEGFQFFSFTVTDLQGNVYNIVHQNSYPLSNISVDVTTLNIAQGFDAELNIFIDFGLLFAGINLEILSEGEIEEQILNNFSFSFGER